MRTLFNSYLKIPLGSNRSFSKETYPIGIVGGGPVGLLLSLLLSKFRIKHFLIEGREKATIHPQAHFINARTMEIIQSNFPVVYKELVHVVADPSIWRDFVYCYSMLGREYARVNNFQTKEAVRLWAQSPSNVAHLPQNIVESIFRNHVQVSDFAMCYFGHRVTSLVVTHNGKVEVSISALDEMNRQHKHKQTCPPLVCDYLVGADGAGSFVRKWLDIPLRGQTALSTMVNVHFSVHCGAGTNTDNSNNINRNFLHSISCKSGMLYFVFNESLVGVFVAHDISKGEFVCQIPVFPPYTDVKDYTPDVVKGILLAGVGGGVTERDITVHSVQSWTMNAVVADRLRDRNVFLVGDAAHQFPPAGGFGMNTGMQDAHNLAWKLALAVNGLQSHMLLESYHAERSEIAKQNTALSLKNFTKSVSVASALGVNPAHAHALVSVFNAFSSAIPLPVRQQAVRGGLGVGLTTLSFLRAPHVLGDFRVDALRKIVSKNASLQLLYPKEDLHFSYDGISGALVSPTDKRSQRFLAKSPHDARLTSLNLHPIAIGCRIPHFWLLHSSPSSPSPSPSPSSPSKRTVFSSALLQGHVRALLNRELCGFSEVVPLHHVDPFLLLVSECSREGVANTLADIYRGKSAAPLFLVVGVDTSPLAEDWGMLQRRYKYPSYANPDVGTISLATSFDSPPPPSSYDLLSDGSCDVTLWLDKHGNGPHPHVLTCAMVDLSHHWDMYTNRTTSGSSAHHDHGIHGGCGAIVVVRPDCHVAGIYTGRENNILHLHKVDLQQHNIEVRTFLVETLQSLGVI